MTAPVYCAPKELPSATTKRSFHLAAPVGPLDAAYDLCATVVAPVTVEEIAGTSLVR
jgi:hypothetical protein